MLGGAIEYIVDFVGTAIHHVVYGKFVVGGNVGMIYRFDVPLAASL